MERSAVDGSLTISYTYARKACVPTGNLECDMRESLNRSYAPPLWTKKD